MTAEVLACAKELLAIGCFCIGTNQVDLEFAASRGITVFNSPFSNSRSVAEMTIANIINMARQMGDRSNECHRGVWNKVSKGCYEIRGKKLGIVGMFQLDCFILRVWAYWHTSVSLGRVDGHECVFL